MNRFAPRFSLLLLVVFCVLLVPAPAHATLDSALQAQAMLGGETWSRVLEIRNAERGGMYPAIVYATVFEFNGILWFYTDANGTQSLSRYQGRFEQDKAELGPLLREICPGFRSFVELPDRASEPRDDYPRLRNGCFIETVHQLRRLRSSEERIVAAKLLFFYMAAPDGVLGHSGLLFTTGRGHFFWDPAAPGHLQAVDEAALASPMEAAQFVTDGRTASRLLRARFLSVREVARPQARFAEAVPAAGGRSGGAG